MDVMLNDTYRPLDLSAYCNAGADILAAQGQKTPVGHQTLQGLPFHIAAGDRAFIGFGSGLRPDPLSIPISAVAHVVVIAHRLLESELMAGGAVGEPVATYIFHLADGNVHRVVIRERFEITDLPTFGQMPFGAMPFYIIWRCHSRCRRFAGCSGPADSLFSANPGTAIL